MGNFSTYFKTYRFALAVSFLTLISGLGIGYILFHHVNEPSDVSISDNCTDYPFINPTLDCGEIDQNISRIRNIDIQVRKIIEEEKEQKNITRASVFYRDLNTRRWFGVDDTADFYGASLLKLPLSIIYFKFAEIAPDVLNQKLTLPKEDRNKNEFFPSHKKILTPGTEYTIQQLIEGMIIDSDNNPVAVLDSRIDPIFRSDILHDLGIEESTNDPTSPERYVNVRIYSNILRFLYNASYLNLEYSNTLLEYLSRTTFSEGIGKAIPEGIPIAHKFGEATRYAEDGSVASRILHDCGIVYAPNNPYVICIMTEGSDYTAMSNTIQRIAKTTFEFDYSQ